MSLYVQPRISVHHAHLPINEQSSNSLSGDGLASGLVDGLFPAQLFTSGISPWHELQPLRAVSRSWRAAIQRDRQPWADVLAFLNHQNQLDQKEPDEDEDEDGDEGWIGSIPVPGDPRPFAVDVPLYNQVVAMIRFQKQCVANVLDVYDRRGWNPGDYSFTDPSCAGEVLRDSDEDRYHLLMGLAEINVIKCCLMNKTNDWGGDWNKGFGGVPYEQFSDTLCGSSYSEECELFFSFFGDFQSTEHKLGFDSKGSFQWTIDPTRTRYSVDACDTKIREFVFGEFENVKKKQQKTRGLTGKKNPRPSKPPLETVTQPNGSTYNRYRRTGDYDGAYVRMLGPTLGVECDLFGWIRMMVEKKGVNSILGYGNTHK